MIERSRHTLDTIKQQASRLVRKGALSRQQSIYTLYQYIPPREWIGIERELEKSNFLLRDPIGDLLSQESWTND